MPTRLPQVFRSTRVVAADGEAACTVHVRAGRIERIGAHDDTPADHELIELGDVALLPGFVDSHVHINEPGRTEWEGFESATRAAAAGGVTTLVDMPLNSIPPTTTPAALSEKLRAAAGRLTVDVAFWGGVVPGNVADLRGLHEAGVAGFKCFLAPSGVPEFGHVDTEEMEMALRELARLDSPLLVHAEDPRLLSAAPPSRDYATYLATRPVQAEVSAVEAVLRAARRADARVHIVHVSSADALAAIAGARSSGVRVTCETCPHYLWFDAARIPPGRTEFKCAPPIREATQRDALRAAVRDGSVDLIASDHSPAPPELKQRTGGDFIGAWGGIASLEIAPRVTWTVMREQGDTLSQFSALTARAPARLAGLGNRKGVIAPGMDADLVAFDPDSEAAVEQSRLHHRHGITPYQGAILRGRVVRTWLRGELTYDGGKFPGGKAGQTLLRSS